MSALKKKIASVRVVFLDFLRSPGEPTEHHGLAGLAEVLQHSSLRPRSKSTQKDFINRKNFSKNNIKNYAYLPYRRVRWLWRVNLATMFRYWSQHISVVWSRMFYIYFDVLSIHCLCCPCSGLEDQWVCGFEVLWGSCDPKKHQHVGYSEQLQCEHSWPDVSRSAYCICSAWVST